MLQSWLFYNKPPVCGPGRKKKEGGRGGGREKIRKEGRKEGRKGRRMVKGERHIGGKGRTYVRRANTFPRSLATFL